jgi:hypothetical protein
MNKKSLICFSLAGLILIGANCGGGSQTFKHQPNDTIKTLALWWEGKNGFKYDVVYRITIDSLAFVDKDSTTKVKKWTRIPTYYIPITDTIRDSNKKPVKDSITGQYKFKTGYWPFYSGGIVRDFSINIDSLTKNYKPTF